ncbi:hypothetical protein P5673_007141 [Acropora cervicornis]|uniref:Uncharacterized protein n=1 Tax=Acropora cervicornis TaxID=6130 RepID=A0AAD9QVC0_ACRCE|nr:hypothetical protein P5673_007141 [Acropora cervicornis]
MHDLLVVQQPHICEFLPSLQLISASSFCEVNIFICPWAIGLQPTQTSSSRTTKHADFHSKAALSFASQAVNGCLLQESSRYIEQ